MNLGRGLEGIYRMIVGTYLGCSWSVRIVQCSHSTTGGEGHFLLPGSNSTNVSWRFDGRLGCKFAQRRRCSLKFSLRRIGSGCHNSMPPLRGQCYYFRRKIAFFSKAHVTIKKMHYVVLFWVKNPIFCLVFWRKYFYLIIHRCQVDDGEYFQTLPGNSVFLFLRSGESWHPAGTDSVRSGRYPQGPILWNSVSVDFFFV
jgi:hypothetical protein